MTSVTIDRTDGLNSAAAIKGPCLVATTANIVLSGLQTVDGVVLLSGDRVLVKEQTSGSENGLYVVDTGPWRRSKDFNRTNDVVQGTIVYVTSGTASSGRSYAVATAGTIAIGTTSITFTEAFVSPGNVPSLIEAWLNSLPTSESSVAVGDWFRNGGLLAQRQF